MNATIADKTCQPKDKLGSQNEPCELPRLAFSLQETAAMLGLSYITVYRLVQRGKLKTSGPLRTKLITKTEIDRFLS